MYNTCIEACSINYALISNWSGNSAKGYDIEPEQVAKNILAQNRS